MRPQDEISKPKAYFLMGLLGLSILVTSVGISELVSSFRHKADTPPITITTTEGFTKKPNFPNVQIQGKAALVYDFKTKEVLFEKNAEVQLPLASLTKIMVALTAQDLFPQNATLTINQSALTTGDGGFRDGQEWHLKDLLEATLVKSSNDGASAIASAYGAFEKRDQGSTPVVDGTADFVAAMNKKAKSLGLIQTYFLNETGLDESASVAGAYGSARDVAQLFYTAVSKFPQAFEGTSYDSVTVASIGKTKYTVENTNQVVSQIPGLIASKTGYTDLAGGNLVILFDLGPMHPVAVAVMGSTRDGRFEDTLGLVRATLQYYGALDDKNSSSN